MESDLLRPIASSSDRREACTCKNEKSTLTEGGSGGDPPTVKSERRLGNSKKGTRSSTREGER